MVVPEVSSMPQANTVWALAGGTRPMFVAATASTIASFHPWVFRVLGMGGSLMGGKVQRVRANRRRVNESKGDEEASRPVSRREDAAPNRDYPWTCPF